MNNKGRLLLIADIESFVITQMPDILSVSHYYKLNQQQDVDCFIDWCVNQILTDTFQMIVFHHYRHDIYKCVYSELKHQLTQSFTRCIIPSDLNLLRGCEVKTLVNDKDLFITRRFKYDTTPKLS